MTESQILDWLEQNAVTFNEGMDEVFTLTWIDRSGIGRSTSSVSLRSCVGLASQGTYNLEDL